MASDQESQANGERRPLLSDDRHTDPPDGGESGNDGLEHLSMGEDDPANPRHWSRARKLGNVAVVASMSILSPLASSMFTPGIEQIADGLGTDVERVIACTTGFVIMLGLGPLILAPLSETLGRRPLFLVCFSIFTLLQIPAALAPNVETLIATRTLAGFFGSVGVANGGGTISDMFLPSERATIFGWYLLGPLLGPALGPLLGGLIVEGLVWRWIFIVLTIICAVNTLSAFFLLHETYVPVILSKRKVQLQHDHDGSKTYTFDGEDPRPLRVKLLRSLTRPILILAQPIVLTMSLYQAFVFATTYSIYTNMQQIFGRDGFYGFSTSIVGLLYLGPGLGFLLAAWFLVPRIDTVYNALTRRNDGVARPEFRLPLANIGSIFIPVSLFWFGWSVQHHTHWAIPIVGTFFYGIGQVMILNTTQNYYIDTFERYAASAIAAGGVMRSILGGIIPLFGPALFARLGYGWGISVFGFVALALAPAPLIFYYRGAWVRERVQIKF